MRKEEEASSLQQLGGLLWSILSSSFSSLFLSIGLAFREARARLCSRHATGSLSADLLPPPPTSKRGSAISFYEGTVWHERRIPSVHKFSYSVRYALVNLDFAPSCFTATSAHHHMTASKARSISGTTGPVYLLTVPTSVGYEQNPLSVYYCFDDDETHLSICIAEVTNTPWGERVTFLFDPNGDTVAKPLHVSPFMDMLGFWRMKACVPEQNITIKISVQHPEHGNYFTASLCANRVECSQTSFEGFFWLMPHKTAVGIYWQALLLWWKGVGFCQHPKYVDGDAYRGRAIERDRELSKDQEDRCIKLTDAPSLCSHMLKTSRLNCSRSYTWYEAHWPWT
eukprot:c2925_g1_i1 orf=81-1100(+)